jgi:hypothetical protein
MAVRADSVFCRVRIACLVAAALFAQPAFAATQVYHSPADDGVPAVGPPVVSEGGVRSVFLYIDGGSVPSQTGEACVEGAGDEICGYELHLTGLDGLTFADFTSDPAADLIENLSAGELKLNGLDGVSPSPGPKRIGELLVNATTGGAVELTSGEAVGADLESEQLSATTIVSVPEPGRLMLLGSGLLFLVCVGRKRMR